MTDTGNTDNITWFSFILFQNNYINKTFVSYTLKVFKSLIYNEQLTIFLLLQSLLNLESS